jgi:hypothetical protein
MPAGSKVFEIWILGLSCHAEAEGRGLFYYMIFPHSKYQYIVSTNKSLFYFEIFRNKIQIRYHLFVLFGLSIKPNHFQLISFAIGIEKGIIAL